MPPTLRPLHLGQPRDLALEASRAGLPRETLAAALPAPPRCLFVFTGCDARDQNALQSASARHALPVLLAPASTGQALGGRGYVAATDGEIVRFLHDLPAPLRGAGPLLPDRPVSGLPCRRRFLPFGSRPLIMGILNVTPDSFSDGGACLEPESAIRRARELYEEGAEIIDVGGESTRPGSEPVPEEVELARVLPVLEALGPDFPCPISIDTYKGGVARRALECGAEIVNDITGLRVDPGVASAAAEFEAPLVLSHIRGTPRTMQQKPQYQDLMAEVAQDLIDSAGAAMRAGVAREAIVLDPGIGFGKSFDDNLELLRRLPELAGLGPPLLVGASRKRFLTAIHEAPPDERLAGSLAAAEAARQGGARIVRVHDVRATARFFKTIAAILEPPTSPTIEPGP